MEISKNGRVILSIDDWFKLAPPKKGIKQWKNYRSAKELARLWTADHDTAVANLTGILKGSFGPVELVNGEPEVEIKIDEFRGEHRNSDLVISAVSGLGPLCVHIEAKADESFGELIGEYYDSRQNRRSNVPPRIDHLLMQVFGSPLTEELRTLRYQLLHATVAAHLDGCRKRAAAVVFLVHEFHSEQLSSRKLIRNSEDFAKFFGMVPGGSALQFYSNKLYGPILLDSDSMTRSTPLYFGKQITSLTQRLNVD